MGIVQYQSVSILNYIIDVNICVNICYNTGPTNYYTNLMLQS